MPKAETIEVENINTPGRVTRVNAATYGAMRSAVLTALPTQAPGLNFKDSVEAVKPHLPEDLFPGGATSGWWFKTVQLDLEAKGVLKRSETKPLKWRRV